MTVLYSHLVIVPTHPGRAGSRSAVLRGCPETEPAVPPRLMTAGFGMPTAAQRPRCCRYSGRRLLQFGREFAAAFPGLAGLAGKDTVRRLDLRRDLVGEIRLTLSGLDGGGGPI
jgi:hypothetical protein